jgi:penicillin-binding protein 1C
MFDTGRRPRVAWKTGTSYGFRDAWAIGGTPRYSVGVWVGRPDGTPLPGQYGAVTALPLLFEVIDSLPRSPRDPLRIPMPAGVAETTICWPLGTAADAQSPELCRKRMPAWTLDGVVPPTFAERQARLWSAGIEAFDVDATTGKRLSAECREPHASKRRQIARWPALAMPWLPAAWRAQASLPPLSPDCVDDGRGGTEALHIEGVNDGATLARAPGRAGGVKLSLRAVGATSRVQWLLDGRWIGETEGARPLSREFAEPGRHELTALADSGAWDSLRFAILQ